ncbi:MAG: tRNA (adenosine(37)-N6)-threonylcarbamoyltransferase complex ATPase subunit type 1 TsaE [Gammaproteobacteria bacterium]|nr:MAG: tRNA (adenosine(37)-N6)-threonylcarbamoyltransferase complex ATPase subunit type 1 TsaE [Gammaproteobacteria bacterium]
MAESDCLILADASATEEQGRRLGAALLAVRPRELIVFLEGDLGAGKTTLVRGFLRALGHRGRVPSPTYTLIEPYEVAGFRVCHIDLYRIRAPAEVDGLGLADQLGPGSVALIEWPERGAGELPLADIRLCLEIAADGRLLQRLGTSEIGRSVLAHAA